MGALFQIRNCRLYQIAQVVDILPLGPQPEDFTDFDAVFGQPDEVVVVDHLVLTSSLTPVSAWLHMGATNQVTHPYETQDRCNGSEDPLGGDDFDCILNSVKDTDCNVK